MADLPWSAFASVRAGPFKTLSALWRHLSSEALWEARAESRRPWVCPTIETLMTRTGRCERSVGTDLKRLRAGGWIERAWGELAGRRVYGLALADPEGVDAALVLAPVGEDTEESCGVDPQGSAGSDGKLPQTAGPRARRGRVVDPRPNPAEHRSEHPRLLLLPAGDCGVAADAAAADAARRSLRGQPAEMCGAEQMAEALVGILGEVHLPAPAQRIVADRPTLRRARVILEVPTEGRDEADVQEARRERFQQVLTIAMEFAEICQAEPEQRRWWCGQVLDLEGQRREGRIGVSRWEHVEHRVALRRAGQVVGGQV